MYAINQVPIRDMSQSLTGCCPPFDPAEWDGQTFTFKDKLFMKFTTRSLFHIPLNMGPVMKKATAEVAAATAAGDEYLMLSDEVSPWKAEHYMSVAKSVPGADMVSLSGSYLAKVFEGEYKEMRSWYHQLIKFAKARGNNPIKTFFNYATCPKCAKAYGKNYVVGLAQVAA